MKRITAVIAVAALLGTPVALAQPAPPQSAPPVVSASAVQPPASDSSQPLPDEVRELRRQIAELQKTIAELREEVAQEPQYLDQTDSPITGS